MGEKLQAVALQFALGQYAQHFPLNIHTINILVAGIAPTL
jgi:hypothetical protein